MAMADMSTAALECGGRQRALSAGRDDARCLSKRWRARSCGRARGEAPDNTKCHRRAGLNESISFSAHSCIPGLGAGGMPCRTRWYLHSNTRLD